MELLVNIKFEVSLLYWNQIDCIWIWTRLDIIACENIYSVHRLTLSTRSLCDRSTMGSTAELQALLRFLAQDAKIPLAAAMGNVKALQKADLAT